MYLLTLSSNAGKNILSNQYIYWYPLRLSSGQLTSINIATISSYNWVLRFWAGERIKSVFPLDDKHVCFFYSGSDGDTRILNYFREKPLIVRDDKINYYFSNKEIEDLCDKYNLNLNNAYNEILNIINSKLNQNDWEVNFQKIDNICNNCTKEIAPNPILHILNLLPSNFFSEDYYKGMFRFLLNHGFLVNWIHPKDIPENLIDVFNNWLENHPKVKNMNALGVQSKIMVEELFQKSEIFSMLYLAAQYGSEKSVFKILFNNLSYLLPDKEKEEIKEGYYFFQPKILVESLELHFIQSANYKSQINNLYLHLNKIFDEVSFYDIMKHKILSNDDDIFFAMRHHEPTNRYRFYCKSKISPHLDYIDLQKYIYELVSAIKTILAKNKLNNTIKEMWIKSIEFEIITPKPFEDDIVSSLANNWLIIRHTKKDFTDEKKKKRFVYVEINCDYLVFKGGKFIFSFDYSREIQLAYTTINDKLKLNHNFSITL